MNSQPICVIFLDERFIIKRGNINFNLYNEEPKNPGPITHRGLRQDFAAKVRIGMYEQSVGVKIHDGFKIERPLAANLNLWSCRARRGPAKRESHSFLNVRSLRTRDCFDSVTSVTNDGCLVTFCRDKLTYSKTFFEKNAVEVAVYRVNVKLGRKPTSLWVDPMGKTIIAGYQYGIVKVFTSDCITGKFSPSGFLSCINSTQQSRLTEKQRSSYEHSCKVACVTMHPTTHAIYWCCSHGVSCQEPSGRGSLFRPRASVSKDATCMKLSPTGTFLATAYVEDGVRIWNAWTMEPLHSLVPGTTVGKALDWHPWMSGLLVTSQYEWAAATSVWQVTRKGDPFVGRLQITTNHTFFLSFHPDTAELLLYDYTDISGPGTRGLSTLKVLNGAGEVIDCSKDVAGLVTEAFWSPDRSILVCFNDFDYCEIITFEPMIEKKPAPKPKRRSLLEAYLR